MRTCDRVCYNNEIWVIHQMVVHKDCTLCEIVRCNDHRSLIVNAKDLIPIDNTYIHDIEIQLELK